MKRAFSLIEILIVVAIIGIIAALGVNSLLQMQTDAKRNTLLARLKQLNIAKQQYLSENGRLEAEQNWASPPNNLINGQPDTPAERRYNLLKRYIERPQALFSEFMPDGCTLGTPANIHATYTAAMTLDNGTKLLNLQQQDTNY